MGISVGVLVTEHIAIGLVENNQQVGQLHLYPEFDGESNTLDGMPSEEIVGRISDEIENLCAGQTVVEAVGVGFPGIIQNGLIEDSPNLNQTKGVNLETMLSESLRHKGLDAPVRILNDADALAAGLAATLGQLDRIVRVWFLGVGIGWGRYPLANVFGEGGHTIVTLDPKENYCGCGGIGHLEGIMGYRAMRLRFLDMEPEEVFEEAKAGDARCSEFVQLWHRALAAATATSIHLDGPGKFFISGPNAKFVQTGLVKEYLREMVKMSPLEGSTFEVIETSDTTAIIGAAVSAKQKTE